MSTEGAGKGYVPIGPHPQWEAAFVQGKEEQPSFVRISIEGDPLGRRLLVTFAKKDTEVTPKEKAERSWVPIKLKEQGHTGELEVYVNVNKLSEQIPFSEKQIQENPTATLEEGLLTNFRESELEGLSEQIKLNGEKWVAEAKKAEEGHILANMNINQVITPVIVSEKGEFYILSGEIGKGQYKTVKEASLMDTTNRYAVALADPKHREVLAKEAAILKDLKGEKGVMQLHKITTVTPSESEQKAGQTGAKQVAYMMELYDPGDLDVIVVHSRYPDESIREVKPLEQRMDMAIGMAEGLKNVHKAGYLHRDLKPGNILLRKNEPAISDFGLATKASEKGVIGTPFYYPHEGLESWIKFATGEKVDNLYTDVGPHSDVEALGLIFYELFFPERGTPPWYDKINKMKESNDPKELNSYDHKAEVEKFIAELYELAVDPERGDIALLIRAMMDPNPANRPTAAEAMAELEKIRKNMAQEKEEVAKDKVQEDEGSDKDSVGSDKESMSGEKIGLEPLSAPPSAPEGPTRTVSEPGPHTESSTNE